MRVINEIIIHCTATPEGREVKVAEIRRWHVQRGFSDIGYHYIIHLDGTVETGRPFEQVGAHCVGHNRASIGVCYVGGIARDGKTPKDTRTAAQNVALAKLVRDLCAKFPKVTIHGHREFAAKACPSFDVQSWLKTI